MVGSYGGVGVGLFLVALLKFGGGGDWGVVVRSGGSKTWGFCSLTGIRPMKKEKESTAYMRA